MAKFKKKNAPTSSAPSVSPEQWLEWNKYVFDCLDSDEIEMKGKKKGLRKEEALVGHVKLLCEFGYQEQEDSKWDTKCEVPSKDEENSAEELEFMAKEGNEDVYFAWVKEYDETKKDQVWKRKQCRPSKYPLEEYGMAVDFPDIEVDYAKMPLHPLYGSGESDIKPFRISYNGLFKGEVQRKIIWRNVKQDDGSYGLSPNHIFRKIARAVGTEEDIMDGDLSAVVDASLTWTVQMSLTEGDKGSFFNVGVKEPRKMSKGDQKGMTPCDNEFCGVVLHEEEHTEEELRQIRPEYRKRMEQAIIKTFTYKKDGEEVEGSDGVAWADCDLKKQLDALKPQDNSKRKSGNEDFVEEEEKKEEVKKEVKKAPAKKAAKPEPEQEEEKEEETVVGKLAEKEVNMEEELGDQEFNDDVGFGDDGEEDSDWDDCPF